MLIMPTVLLEVVSYGLPVTRKPAGTERPLAALIGRSPSALCTPRSVCPTRVTSSVAGWRVCCMLGGSSAVGAARGDCMVLKGLCILPSPRARMPAVPALRSTVLPRRPAEGEDSIDPADLAHASIDPSDLDGIGANCYRRRSLSASTRCTGLCGAVWSRAVWCSAVRVLSHSCAEACVRF